MSNKYDGCIRAFVQWSKTGYSQYMKEEWKERINFGFYSTEGDGTAGWLCVRWYSLRADEQLVAKLEVFPDAWDALHQFSDVLARMAEWNGKYPQPDDFVQILTECGFKDLTSILYPPEPRHIQG